MTIGNSVTEIGQSAFGDCSSLTAVIIGNSVTEIGAYAFSGTAWLKNQPNGVVYAGKVAYIYKGTMPENTEGTLGISNNAFSECSGLTAVTIPNSVTSIGSSAFSHCSGLTEVTIPNSVTKIGYGAFSSCTSLTSVTIPNSVTEIGDFTFGYCSALTEVYCYAKEPPTINSITLNSRTFYKVNVAIATLYVPEESIEEYKTTAPWNSFGTIVALPDFLRGDVNGDGEVNVGDLVSVSNYMAGDVSVSKDAADVNQDGEVNVGDMVVISNIMSGNE